MDNPSPAVNLNNLALAALVGPPHHLHLVVLANGDGSEVVLVAEVDRERRAHQNSPDARRRGEVCFAALTPGAGDARIVLHRRISLPQSISSSLRGEDRPPRVCAAAVEEELYTRVRVWEREKMGFDQSEYLEV